ncbi:MAG: cadmium-translocating P-type ATPase [Christensenellaceae bacterium]|nr:cadmium-translocating P-type ATPase [Christensenellaceae bacterium]
MTNKQKRELAGIIIGTALFVAALIAAHLIHGVSVWLIIPMFAISYLVLGLPVLIEAAYGLIGRRFMDENFLMSIASIGAICVGELHEAILVMLLYRIGELFQSIAVGKSRASIAELMDMRPDSAVLETDAGEVQVDPEQVRVGDILIVRAGDRIPLDGVVIEGTSSLNTAALTGESIPRDVFVGDEVSAGCINLNGTLRIRAEKEYADSTVSRMLELIEGAAANKSKSEDFITKFARWYTPSVVALVVLLAIIPPLAFGQDWFTWIYRALTFLVISCPCALVISVPLTFFGGIGGAGRKGILIKGSNYMETLAKCDTVVFDKTGTLTKGSFTVTKIIPANESVTEKKVLMYAAACERYSTHPLASCIRHAYGDDRLLEASDFEELAGLGVSANVDGVKVYAGNAVLMQRIGAACTEIDAAGTLIHVSIAEEYLGCIVISDELKSGAHEAVNRLHNELSIKTVMLTGDRHSIAESTAKELGIGQVHAELLPGDKVDCIEKLIDEERSGYKIAFVGDGINDAPVLTRADIGIAMGGLSSDAAIEAADAVIMDDRIEKVPLAIRIAKRTVNIAWQNIVFALAVKLIVLVLGALGYAEMWMALIADVGVCLVAILNAMRAMSITKAN